MPIKSIAEALGLGTDADEAACLTAITGLSTGKVDKSVHDEALTKLSAATQELATLKADGRKKDVDDLLEGALADKKIFPLSATITKSSARPTKGLTRSKPSWARPPRSRSVRPR